jgi:hypothetical protein
VLLPASETMLAWLFCIELGTLLLLLLLVPPAPA